MKNKLIELMNGVKSFYLRLPESWRKVLPYIGTILLTIAITLITLLTLTGPRRLQLTKAPKDSPYVYAAYDPKHGFAAYIAEKETDVPIVKANFAGGATAEFVLKGLSEDLTKPRRLGNKVTFKNIRPNMDLNYETLENGIKEEIILNSAVESNQFDFSLTTSGATPQIVKDTGYGTTFFDAAGTYLFHFQQPFAVDASGARTDSAYYLVQAGKDPGLFEVNLFVNNDWLQDKSRVYPITIDPTIVYNTTSLFSAGSFNRVFDTGSGASPNLTTYYQELPTDQYTIALWHMDETANDSCSDGKDVCDSSGNANNGTVINTSITTTGQRLGGAARTFAGNGYFKATSAALATGGTKTVEAWIKTTDTQGMIYSSFDGNGYELYIQASNLVLWSNGGTALDSGIAVNDGEWHHVAAAWDGVNGYLYLDGVLVGSGARTITTNASNEAQVGDYCTGACGTPNASWYLDGTIDEIRVSSIARTPEEIKLAASRRPYSVYTSDVIDFNSNVSAWNPFTWTELGVTTSDGETLKDSTSLIAQWNFNETSGTTAVVAAGSCGTNCNGTLTNMTTSGQDASASNGWTSNNRRWGAGAVMFDGTDDYILTTYNAAQNPSGSNFSIEAWVNPRVITVSNRIIGTSASFTGYRLHFDGADANKLEFYIGNGSAYRTCSKRHGMRRQNWYHVAATYDGSNFNLYVNGKNIGTCADSFTPNWGTSAIALGGAPEYWSGGIDSTRIYSRTLTAAEILSNYNAGNLEVQTRAGSDPSPDDGSWEEWRPVTGETAINSFDSDSGNWSWDNTATYMPQTKGDDSTRKIEGTGSLKLTTGIPQTDASTVGLWHLDETGGSGAYLKDVSSTADHGTPTGTTIANGISNKARYFNGSSDFVSFPYNSVYDPIAPGTTYQFWIKPAETLTANLSTTEKYRVFLGNFDCSTSKGWQLAYDGTANGRLYAATGNGTSSSATIVSTAQTLTAGNWYQVTMILYTNATTSKIYLNGTDVSSTATSFGYSASTQNLTLGRQATNGCSSNYRYTNATFDEVRVITGALSVEAIAESYRLGRDHYLTKTISSTDLSAKTSLPFYVAAGRPGTYLEATIGESAFANYQPDANTIALMHLDEKSGSGAYLLDATSNNNDGTPTGAAFAQGRIGKARYFDNANDYVDLGSGASLDFGNNGALTASGWVYPTTLADYDSFVSKVVSGRGGTYSYMTVFMANGRLTAYNTTAGWVDICPASSIGTNKWSHVAFAYNGTTMSGYVNGQLCGSASFVYTDNAAHNVYIGSWYSVNTLYDFNGYIDEVTVSNTTRSAEEIRQAAEIGRRSHQITIDFGAKLDSGNLIEGTSDTSFTVDATYYGLGSKGSQLFKGDKIIIKENYDGTEYIAQGTVTAVTASTGAVTVASWDSGSTAPSGGFTINADVFKWQREYFDLSGSLSTHRNAITQLTLRPTDGNSGHTLWLDDLRSAGSYLTDPAGSTITSSTGNQYLQFRLVNTSSDYAVSPSVTTVTSDFQSLAPAAPTIGAATALSSSSIQWGFTDNASNETGFKVYDTSGVLKATCALTDQTSCTETGLSPNTEYTRKVVAYNANGNSLYSSTVAKYTLAAVPSAPAVTGRTGTTVAVNPDPGTNPAATTFAIYKEEGSTCDGSGGSYIAANGSDNGSTAVWQTDSTWSSVTATGLNADKGYVFCVKAKNADNIETAFGSLGAHTGYIPVSGDYVYTSDTSNTSTFITRYVDGNNASRYVLGVDNGGVSNTANFEVKSGILTVSSTDSFVVGSLTLTGGSIAVADGSTIEVGKKLWLVDADNDGYSSDRKLYIDTQPAGGRRKSAVAMSATADCDDSSSSYTTNKVTGGTVTESGGYRIHTFTSSGTLTVSCAPTSIAGAQSLIVAGGGGGGQSLSGWAGAGGGGAGGYLYDSSFTLTQQAYSVTVGGGGAGSTSNGVRGSNGGNSVFNGSTAVGGGGGGAGSNTSTPGFSGGSGGGGAYSGQAGGTGTASQGYSGGTGSGNWGGGGGGSGGSGSVGNYSPAGGGPGTANSITGTSVTYAAGGNSGNNPVAGAANTGNGGGGQYGGYAYCDCSGQNGGSGIVVVRYPL